VVIRRVVGRNKRKTIRRHIQTGGFNQSVQSSVELGERGRVLRWTDAAGFVFFRFVFRPEEVNARPELSRRQRRRRRLRYAERFQVLEAFPLFPQGVRGAQDTISDTAASKYRFLSMILFRILGNYRDCFVDTSNRFFYIYIYYKYYKYSRRGVSTPPRGKSLDIPENPESKRMWQNIKCSNVSKISKEFNSNSNRFKRSLIIGMATSEWESSMDQSEGKDRPKECATSAQRPPPETLSSSLPERNKRGFRMSSLRICQCATTANNLRSPNISLFSTSRVDPNSICKIISNMKWLDIKYHFH